MDFPAITVCNIYSIRKEFQLCAENNLNCHECLNISEPGESDIKLESTTKSMCKNITDV